MNIRQDILAEMKLLLQQFNKVSEKALTEEFDADEKLQSIFGDIYPFDDSFDDVCSRVKTWVDTFEKSITLKTYEYSIQSNTIWTSFDNGTVTACAIDEARLKAKQEIEYNFKKANESLSHCNITEGFNISFDENSIVIKEVK